VRTNEANLPERSQNRPNEAKPPERSQTARTKPRKRQIHINSALAAVIGGGAPCQIAVVTRGGRTKQSWKIE
jgi:hypothetical protein